MKEGDGPRCVSYKKHPFDETIICSALTEPMCHTRGLCPFFLDQDEAEAVRRDARKKAERAGYYVDGHYSPLQL